MTSIIGLLRGKILIQNYRSVQRLLPLIGQNFERLNNRTIHFSAFSRQQTNSTVPTTKSDAKNTSVLGNGDDQTTRTPFIFSKPSSGTKFVDDAPSNKSEEDEKHEREKRAAWDMKMLRYTSYFLGVWFCSTIGYIILVWGGPQVGENGDLIEDEFSKYPAWLQYPRRAFQVTVDYWQTIKDPTSDKLLPEPLPAGYQPTYTLVIEMSGILLSPEWNYNTGWRYKKRPGLEYFLKEIGYPVYEVVIYTKETSLTAAPVVANMDPNHRIMYHLFRENTRFAKGTHVKDLSCLNRDLKKVIFLDWDEKAFQLQPRNALHRLKKWSGDDEDRELFHLATFLRMVAASGIEDVRDVLDHYNQEKDPIQAFLLRQQTLMEAEQRKREAAALRDAPVKKSASLFSGWKKGF